jgi:hypothetical protein
MASADECGERFRTGPSPGSRIAMSGPSGTSRGGQPPRLTCSSARGDDPLLRSSRHIVQDRPLWSVRWADIPQLSRRVRCCPPSWQQFWQQSRRNRTKPSTVCLLDVATCLMVFKSFRVSPPATALSWGFREAVFYAAQDHPAYIPHGQESVAVRVCPGVRREQARSAGMVRGHPTPSGGVAARFAAPGAVVGPPTVYRETSSTHTLIGRGREVAAGMMSFCARLGLAG